MSTLSAQPQRWKERRRRHTPAPSAELPIPTELIRDPAAQLGNSGFASPIVLCWLVPVAFDRRHTISHAVASDHCLPAEGGNIFGAETDRMQYRAGVCAKGWSRVKTLLRSGTISGRKEGTDDPAGSADLAPPVPTCQRRMLEEVRHCSGSPVCYSHFVQQLEQMIVEWVAMNLCVLLQAMPPPLIEMGRAGVDVEYGVAPLSTSFSISAGSANR